MPAEDPETTPQGPRSLSPQSPLPRSSREADVDGWRLASPRELRETRRGRRQGADLRAELSVRRFKWTIPKLPLGP